MATDTTTKTDPILAVLEAAGREAWTAQRGTVAVHVYAPLATGPTFHGPTEYQREKPIPAQAEAFAIVRAVNTWSGAREALAELTSGRRSDCNDRKCGECSMCKGRAALAAMEGRE